MKAPSSDILLELERPSLGRKFVVPRKACGSGLVKLDTQNLEATLEATSSCKLHGLYHWSEGLLTDHQSHNLIRGPAYHRNAIHFQ